VTLVRHIDTIACYSSIALPLLIDQCSKCSLSVCSALAPYGEDSHSQKPVPQCHRTHHVFGHVTNFKNFNPPLASPFTSFHLLTLHLTQCRLRLSHRQSSQRHYQMSVDKPHQNYHIIPNPPNSSMQSNKL